MKLQTENNHPKVRTTESEEQEALLSAFTCTIHHFFGSWQTIFSGVTDPRNLDWITYSLESLLCTGVMMFMFRLGARRQINYQLRGNEPSQAKFEALFGVEDIPHGDSTAETQV